MAGLGMGFGGFLIISGFNMTGSQLTIYLI
jgi:hypothetical protein